MKRGFMKTLWVSLVVTSGAIASTAQAADLYSSPNLGGARRAPCDACSAWPGFYMGINGGYGWGEISNLTAWSYQQDDIAINEQTTKLPVSGGFGGGQIGYNIQRDHLVFGIEADFQGADLKGDAHVQAVNTAPYRDIGFVRTDAWAGTNLDWFGTVRGRLGYTISNTLIFATGGFAYGGATDSLRQSVSSSDIPPYPAPATDSAAPTKNGTLTGYAVGGGFETALTPSWSIKAEYLHIDLGTTSLEAASGDMTYTHQSSEYCTYDQGTCVDRGNSSIKMNHTYDTVRVGLNYKPGRTYEPLK
jgi:outer membrane immunogenic protein